MNDVIISVEHLSKRYRLGHPSTSLRAGIGTTTLRESAERLWHRLRGRDPDLCMAEVGISHGAGRKAQGEEKRQGADNDHAPCAMPSASSAMLHAPSALPSAGAILGMRKAEIAGKFDEIVAFSEVERFIDTPVKRYSIAMYVRLAFAVRHSGCSWLREPGALAYSHRRC